MELQYNETTARWELTDSTDVVLYYQDESGRTDWVNGDFDVADSPEQLTHLLQHLGIEPLEVSVTGGDLAGGTAVVVTRGDLWTATGDSSVLEGNPFPAFTRALGRAYEEVG